MGSQITNGDIVKIYLVGGAVRDKLLGREIKERDFVVVGATEEQMLQLGFKKVGRDFPVFLHPKTNEEYALARTERKTGKGYTEFSCFAEPSVTLEEDLKRRDLTINAMAEDDAGNIIDPYNGRADLKNKILRHISETFAEDPVRILRIARFAAKFGDFTVHPSTITLMKKMLADGEVDALVPERVWQEFIRALSENNPERFFEVLNDCDVLPKLFPEINSIFSQAIINLSKATKISQKTTVRFAAIFQSLTIQELSNFCRRLKVPAKYKKLASLTIINKAEFEKTDQLSPTETLELLEKLDAFRNRDRFEEFLLASETALPIENFPSPQFVKLRDSLNRISTLNIKNLIAKNLSGTEIKKIIHEARLKQL